MTETLKPEEILKAGKTILLIDWPNQSIPRALLDAGFCVYSYSPDHYSEALLTAEDIDDISSSNKFLSKNNNDKRYLIFRKLNTAPEFVDVVNVFRPEEELEEIVHKHIIPLKAKVLWIQPPANSNLASKLADKYKLTVVQNSDIAEVSLYLKRIV